MGTHQLVDARTDIIYAQITAVCEDFIRAFGFLGFLSFLGSLVNICSHGLVFY